MHIYIYIYIYVYIIHICTCISGIFPKRAFHEGTFTKKSFHGETFGGNLWGGVVVHGGTYDQIMSREGGSFINAFSNNLNAVNFFSKHVGIFT